MLHIRSLSVAYGHHQVLEGLDLQLAPAQVHGIVGLNGSGKTTLLNALFNLIPCKTRDIYWENQPLQPADIAFLETNNYFYPRLNGREYLQLFQIKHPGFQLEQWANLFDLELDKRIDSYSTGMKKKLALLGTIALDKPIMILDEPYNGLDLESSQKLKQIILELKRKGKTILITSHILESLTTICDEIHYLADKKIAFSIGKVNFDQLEHRIFEEQDVKTGAMIKHLLNVESGDNNHK